jgi:hypothetical protein
LRSRVSRWLFRVVRSSSQKSCWRCRPCI